MKLNRTYKVMLNKNDENEINNSCTILAELIDGVAQWAFIGILVDFKSTSLHARDTVKNTGMVKKCNPVNFEK